MSKKFLTENDRLDSLKERAKLIKESFQDTFNRLNEGNETNWIEQVTLSNGIEYTAHIQGFKMWTSDTIDRYRIFVKNKGLTKQDIQTLFGLVADKNPTLQVQKINYNHKLATEILISSSDKRYHDNLGGNEPADVSNHNESVEDSNDSHSSMYDQAGPDIDNDDNIVKLVKTEGPSGEYYELYIEDEVSDRDWEVYSGQERYNGCEIFDITNPNTGDSIKIIVYPSDGRDVQGRSEY